MWKISVPVEKEGKRKRFFFISPFLNEYSQHWIVYNSLFGLLRTKQQKKIRHRTMFRDFYIVVLLMLASIENNGELNHSKWLYSVITLGDLSHFFVKAIKVYILVHMKFLRYRIIFSFFFATWFKSWIIKYLKNIKNILKKGGSYITSR